MEIISLIQLVIFIPDVDLIPCHFLHLHPQVIDGCRDPCSYLKCAGFDLAPQYLEDYLANIRNICEIPLVTSITINYGLLSGEGSVAEKLKCSFSALLAIYVEEFEDVPWDLVHLAVKIDPFNGMLL